jgi:Zn-dependent protease with chaperone function
MPAANARVLTGISPRAWEHPADRAALSVLRRTSGLEDIVKMLVGGTTEKSIRLLHVGGSVRVTDSQFPAVRKALRRAAEVLDAGILPEIFVTNNPFFNAGALGVKEPFIVLNSAVLHTLTEDEVYCVVAHELGHILSGHNVFKTVLWLLLRVGAGVLPIAGLLVQPLLLALKEWDRMSELTADRAGLLALQSEQECYNVLMKAAGGGDLSQMNVNDFFQQAWEYENQKTILDSILKLLNTVGASHPFPVVRLQELHTWAAGEYRTIVGGTYAKKGDTPPPPKDDLKAGYEHYKSTFKESDDPLLKAARNVGETVGKATEGLRDALKDILRPKQ